MRLRGFLLVILGLILFGAGFYLSQLATGTTPTPYAGHSMLYIIGGIVLILSGGAIIASHRSK